MESESDSSSEIKEEEVIDEQESEDPVIESYEMMDIFALPIRAKPLFHNNREEVEEFPKKLTGVCRLTKIMPASQPYTSIIQMNETQSSKLINEMKLSKS